MAASVIALGAVAAACSSTTYHSSKPGAAVSAAPHALHTSSGAPRAGASAATKGPAAVKAITSDWTTFFDGKTPQAKRVALLQNGSAFAPTLAQQAKTPLASSATAKVTKVTQTSPTMATVNYSVQSGGKTVLPNQTGKAIYQKGTWKVGDASFCGLLIMENGGNTATLPPQCKSVTVSPGATTP